MFRSVIAKLIVRLSRAYRVCRRAHACDAAVREREASSAINRLAPRRSGFRCRGGRPRLVCRRAVRPRVSDRGKKCACFVFVPLTRWRTVYSAKHKAVLISLMSERAIEHYQCCTEWGLRVLPVNNSFYGMCCMLQSTIVGSRLCPSCNIFEDRWGERRGSRACQRLVCWHNSQTARMSLGSATDYLLPPCQGELVVPLPAPRPVSCLSPVPVFLSTQGSGYSALHVAASRNDPNTIRVLLNMKVDVNSTNVRESTPRRCFLSLETVSRVSGKNQTTAQVYATLFRLRSIERRQRTWRKGTSCSPHSHCRAASTLSPCIAQMSGATPLSCAIGGLGGEDGECAALLRAAGGVVRRVEETIAPGSILDVPLKRPRRAIDDRAETLGRMVYTGQF